MRQPMLASSEPCRLSQLPCVACCPPADHGELIAMSRGGVQLELRGPALRTRGNK